jgi:hypothetical protein
MGLAKEFSDQIKVLKTFTFNIKKERNFGIGKLGSRDGVSTKTIDV